MALGPFILYASASVAVGVLSVVIMGWLFKSNQFPVEGKTVVVTGASQGYGLAVSKRLAQKGANVVLVAQNIPKLEKAMKDVASSALNAKSQRFHIISADLRKSSETDRVIAEATEWNNGAPPDTVWCCAGHCLPGFIVDTSSEVLRGQMDTLYWSTANTAQSILKVWLNSTEKSTTSAPPYPRHLVFTSSTLAFYSIAGYGPYSPCKSAIRSLADTLNQEVKYYNGSRKHSSSPKHPEIKIHAVFPMGILSPGFENEEKLKPKLLRVLEEQDEPQQPDTVTDHAFAGLENGDYFITTHWIGHLMKGVGYSVSQTNGWGIVDALWGLAASPIFKYIGWEYMGKCYSLGAKEGREIKGVQVSPYS